MPPKAVKKAAPLNSALFVLKGSVATVLNRPTVTVSASGNKLVLVAKEMLTDDQIAKILQLANDKVKENLPVSFEDLERAVVRMFVLLIFLICLFFRETKIPCAVLWKILRNNFTQIG